MNYKEIIKKTMLQSYRLKTVFEADVTPIVEVNDRETKSLLKEAGYSNSEIRQLMQNSTKIETSHGVKETLGETIPDEYFVLFKSGGSVYSGVFVWAGKKNAILAYTHVSTYNDELVEADSWNEPISSAHKESLGWNKRKELTVWERIKDVLDML